MRRPAAALVLLLAVAGPLRLAAQDAGSRPEPGTARQSELREIVREHDIRTVPERPGLARYLKDVGTSFLSALARRMEDWSPDTFELLAKIAQVAAQVIFVTALALLAAIVGKALFDNYRRRQERTAFEPPVVPVETAGAGRPEGRSREAWAEELRQRIASGEAAAACHALWWWLASTLVPGRVEDSWTSRELLVRAERRDLSAPVRRLDRMLYGAARPGVEDVRRLWSDLEETLG